MLVNKLQNTLAYIMILLEFIRHTSFRMFVDFVKEDRKAVNCTSSYSYSKNILGFIIPPNKERGLRYQIRP